MCQATTSLPSSDSASAIPKDAVPSIPAGRGYEYKLYATGLTSRRRSLFNVAPGTRYVHAAVLYAAPRVHSAVRTWQGYAQTVDLRYVVTLLDPWFTSVSSAEPTTLYVYDKMVYNVRYVSCAARKIEACNLPCTQDLPPGAAPVAARRHAEEVSWPYDTAAKRTFLGCGELAGVRR